MIKVIEITVGATGATRIETRGFTGSTCRAPNPKRLIGCPGDFGNDHVHKRANLVELSPEIRLANANGVQQIRPFAACLPFVLEKVVVVDR